MPTRRFLAILLLLLATTVHAETAREILDRRKALENGARKWNDRQYTMTIKITGRGAERTRQLEAYEKRYGDQRKTVIFFKAPAEVKGTALLSATKASGPTDQSLYLPEIQRVRQVSGRSRNESFVGTDLTYGDLDLIQEVVNWTDADTATALRGEEKVDATPTWVVEFTPKRDDVAYKKIVVWLGKDDLVSRKIELFTDGDQPKKRVLQSEVKTVSNIPVAHQVAVETLGAGTKTVMQLTDVRYDQKLEDDLFTTRALERGER